MYLKNKETPMVETSKEGLLEKKGFLEIRFREGMGDLKL